MWGFGRDVFQGVIHAIADCINASRGLSAIAEFLVTVYQG